MTYIPATNVPLVSKRTRLLEPLLDISVACVYTRIRKRKEKKKKGKRETCVRETDAALDYHSRYDAENRW